ncbi:nucleoside deaminase [Roseivivax sediminis]|uniref:tRNA(Arg) A34 adenosine deaminase TadA n=1 Tax=Roseivivax sediminis TaxID=936889 RepID=A0A1I2A8Q2_9RHOB|nr:nucleoside deaminase [Roseivivax sediminis]SFE39968.1 tRNA(Arg) A34 adenosine deaminase TadA [Roseivivax sediminis]
MTDLVPTETELTALDAAIDHALALHDGSPVFTAAVVADGRLLGPVANEVDKTGDPTRHAEIVAIARAAQDLGTTNLAGATLVASMQPCEMCLTAMRWAGISRLVFAMTRERAPAFFRFHGLTIEDFARAADTPFAWAGGLAAVRLAHIYESP